jgi:transposase
MAKTTRYVGLDVHASSISVAIADSARKSEVRYLGQIPNDLCSIKRMVKKLGSETKLQFCYEAGPCGYVLYWQLVGLGCQIEVVAPTLIPVKAGDRVKTDRRDAEKLARCLRAGELTAVWVPDKAHEALRDLVRARESAKKDQTRARNRLSKFLLRHGRKPSTRMTVWRSAHVQWLDGLRFEEFGSQATMVDYLAEVRHATERIIRLERAIDDAVGAASPETQDLIAALQTLRGVAKLTATTIAAEVGQMSRFEHPSQLMSYAGVVPSESSSGGPGHARRGGITKTGNAHLRRVLIESSWSYRHRPAVRGALRKRQEGQDKAVCNIAWKAQHRLHERYRRMSATDKPKPKVICAVARELLGFIWAVGVESEKLRLA